MERLTHVFIVNDDPLFTHSFVGTDMLLHTPVTAPTAGHTATTTARRQKRNQPSMHVHTHATVQTEMMTDLKEMLLNLIKFHFTEGQEKVN